jgi:hypothetical protein
MFSYYFCLDDRRIRSQIRTCDKQIRVRIREAQKLVGKKIVFSLINVVEGC